MPAPESIPYLTDTDVQRTLTVGEAVELAEKGISADASGRVVGDKFYMHLGEAGFIKPFSGYLLGEELAFVKTFSFYPGNPARFGTGTTSSMVLLFDAQTGLPVCLMDGGWVTALIPLLGGREHLGRPEALRGYATLACSAKARCLRWTRVWVTHLP